MEGIKTYLRPKGKGLKLHLGCGDYWFEGYVNIDIEIYGGTDMLWDIRKGLPFQDQTVSVIEAYEVIEHFSRDEVDFLLTDWKRVLIPGGTVRISVPDMDALIEQYPTDKERVIQYMYGFTGYQQHKWGYTQESMQALFEKHGFRVVTVERKRLPERPDEDKLIVGAIV